MVKHTNLLTERDNYGLRTLFLKQNYIIIRQIYNYLIYIKDIIEELPFKSIFAATLPYKPEHNTNNDKTVTNINTVGAGMVRYSSRKTLRNFTT